MEMYDRPDSYERATRGQTVRIERLALTVLAASATSWLSEQLRGGDLRSGFLNRFAFVLAEHKEKTYALPGTAHTAQLWAGLVHHLRQLSEITGTASMRLAARENYTRW